MNSPAYISLDLRNKIRRGVWGLVQGLLFRPSPRTFHRWRCSLLRLFGATIAPKCLVYPTVRIWAPWNLEMAGGSVLGDGVDCYNVAPIRLCQGAVVSQRTFLCAATHDFARDDFKLVAAAISIGEGAWVCAESFVAPGVEVGSFAIVGARALVLQDVRPAMIVGGAPARELNARPPVSVRPGDVLSGVAETDQRPRR